MRTRTICPEYDLTTAEAQQRQLEQQEQQQEEQEEHKRSNRGKRSKRSQWFKRYFTLEEEMNLNDDVCYLTLTFCSLHELELMRGVSIRWRSLSSSNILWERLSKLLTLGKQTSVVNPLLKHLKERCKNNDNSKPYDTYWREIYWALDADSVRTRLTEEEIVRLNWAFSDGQRLCHFNADKTLDMEGYPKMTWSIKDHNNGGRSAVMIHTFPEHIVERLANWGFVMKNRFIYMITVDGADGSGGSGGSDGSSSNSSNSSNGGSSSSNGGSSHASDKSSLQSTGEINKAFEAARKLAGPRAKPLEVEHGPGSTLYSFILNAFEVVVGVPSVGTEENDADDPTTSSTVETETKETEQ